MDQDTHQLRQGSNPNERASSAPAMDIGPLVSAIIPTHNRARMLARAVRSVLRQTYPRIEIIVVDDASRDDTKEVLESFADPRIRYVRHETNKGGAAARNTGIRAAQGEYIAFLDDDDEWMPEKTEEQLKVLRHYAAVTCPYSHPRDLARFGAKKTIDFDDLRQGAASFGGTPVLMARTDLLKQTMFDESLPRFQDWDLFIRLAQRCELGYLNRSLLISASDDHARITNNMLRMPLSGLEQQLRMLHKHRTFFGDKWFKRHMCKSLLWGIKHRPDRIALLAYVTRRYGMANVVCVLAARAGTKLRAAGPRRAPQAARV